MHVNKNLRLQSLQLVIKNKPCLRAIIGLYQIQIIQYTLQAPETTIICCKSYNYNYVI